MKKSKFLQSSKDMIHRSFNPTKCKTSLRLAASRLKLLRNKKDVQVKQMKREIAQLLESGQDQTARIRVEHVIREEKMMAAYDLLEIYCELTIARLPIIESQKNCPIDLKEAIASIVFASPRCGDVPELLDARKQFSAKYGKEFISAAIELRPQCGVSRLLVEKLSATAPDGQTKNKILSAIAEEHNVTWEPKSFEEKHSGGSSSIKEGNELYSEPPHFEVAELQAHPGSNVNSSPLNSVQQNTEVSMGADNLPPVAVIPSGASTTPNVAYAGEEMPKLSQGDAHNNHLDGRRWKMEFKDAASAAQAAAESAEQASMAARAAAELSSHGRILGRYSAESYNPDAYTIKDYGLETPSNSNSYERSSENKASSEYTRLGKEKIDGRKPNKPTTPTRSEIGDYGGSEEYSQAVPLKSKSSADDDSLYHGVPLVHEHTREKPLKDVSEGEMVDNYNYKTANETGWPEKVEDLGEATVGKQKGFSSSYPQSGTPEYSLAVPVKSKASVDDDSLYRGVPSVMEYTRVNISKDPSEGEIVDNYGYKTASETDWPEKIEDLGEQKSFSSSYTQSGISDYVNIFAKSEEQKFENNTGEDPSMSIMTGIHDKTPDTVSHDFGAVTFDQSDTDSDGLELDSGPLYDEQDLEFHLHSSGRVSPERASMNTGSWSPKSNSNNVVESASLPLYFTRENSFPDITENTTPKEDSELDNIPAARFDDSEGSSSESDEDEYSSRIEDHRNVFHEQNERSRFVHLHEETAESVGSPSKNEGSLAFGSKQYSLSSDDELNSSEGIWKRSQGNAFDVDSLEKLDHVKPSAGKPALGSKDSDIELNDSGNESGPETLEGLSFGRLTGGFRHKGHKHLPFFKNQLDASSVKEETATPSTVASSTDPSRDERPKIGTTSTAQSLHSELHSDSSEDEEDGYLQKSFGPKQPLSAGTMKTKSTPGFSNSIFDSDDSDLDENTPREPVTRKSHLRSGISRRTKAYPSSTANSNSKIHLRSEAPDSDSIDKNPTTAYSKGTSNERESSRRNSGTQEKYEQQPISGDISVPAQSNTQGSTEQLDSSKATPVKRKEPKERSNYGVYDSDNILGKQPSNMYAPDNREEVEASSRKSNHLGKSEQQKPAEVAAKPASSSSWETSEKPKSGKATSNDVQKSKISQKSSSVEDMGNPREKSGADASSGSGASTVDKPKPSLDKVDSTKKASHVHPKLPDYDSLVQSLRMNRS